MKLADKIGGRDNNFNALRMVAALLVLFTHSFVLATGSPAMEPLRARLDMTPGTIAVDVFFFASGFLVTASLLAHRKTVRFVTARALRVFPGLLVMLLLTVFGMGLVVTVLSPSAYLSHPQTARYFIKCVTLLDDVEYWLPGVFGGNPYANAVNGSLWTLPYEVRAYLALAGSWLLLAAAGRRREMLLGVLVVAAACMLGVLVVFGHLGVLADRTWFLRLYFLFAAGASCYVLREYIHLSRAAFLACAVVIALSAFSREVFFFVYTGLIGYLILHVAYLPDGLVRNYNRLGDYSYGVYIYAFPVQQTVVMLSPGISIAATFATSAAATLACAIFSWHFVEARALALKDRF